jgi:glycine dehydrogenase subunit 1
MLCCFGAWGVNLKFIPNSSIKQEMLNEINLDKIDDLYSDIPKKIKIRGLNLDNGLSQQETYRKLKKISKKNMPTSEILSFLGGGIKQHFVPSIVKAISSRSEFYTAYTPYQSEASQGFLQAMFEYQSMITEITGMDVANCSLYDGFTALSEAVLMSSRITKKNKFIIPANIFWEKKSILCNYAKGPNIEIIEVPYDSKTGKINLDILSKKLDNNTSGIYIENPNFFGIFEDSVSEIKQMCTDVGALFVAGIDPLSIGITKSPGDYGADIVIGEGRNLGNQIDFGGSSLGIFACKKDYLRQMPGRIIGMTKDSG